MSTSEQIEYHDQTTCEFAEAVYQKMASDRYGVDFCCNPQLTKLKARYELLSLNNKKYATLTVAECP